MLAYILKIKLRFKEGLIIPKHYNQVLQGFFYNNMDKILADFHHNHGFVHGSRSFKLFTFSKIFGKIKMEREDFIIFAAPGDCPINIPHPLEKVWRERL